MPGLIERHLTDDGVIVTRFAIVGEVHAIRRDDLRGVWEVEGQMYATRSEAMDAAEAILMALDAADPTGH